MKWIILVTKSFCYPLELEQKTILTYKVENFEAMSVEDVLIAKSCLVNNKKGVIYFLTAD